MAITQDILTVYAALAEHIYRRDSNLDQALSLEDISKVLGQLTPFTVPTKDSEGNPLPIAVTGQDGEALSALQSDGDYYYSERGFAGMIVEVQGKYVVVFRGTDTNLSGRQSVRTAAIGDDATRDARAHDVIARPRRGCGDPGKRRCEPGNAGLPRRLRLLAMTPARKPGGVRLDDGE